MGKNQENLNSAAVAWLESHRAYQRYLADTAALFDVFASAWHGSPRALTEAFNGYREALLVQNGFSQSEAQDLFARRQQEGAAN